MSTKVIWQGLAELKSQLRTYAADITADAHPTVQQQAEAAADTMRARYPVVTGRLKGSVVVADTSTEHHANARITNTAPYAHYFEFGTRRSAPGRVFVPILNQFRRALYPQLKQQLPKWNLRVRGDAES